MKSFSLAEKDKIRLTYQDLEKDEISVTCDEDLAEAYNIYHMKNLIKFMVYYSGLIAKKEDSISASKSNLDLQQSQASHNLARESSLMDTLDKQLDNLRKSLEIPKVQQSYTTRIIHNVKLQISPEDLENIFAEIFTSSEVVKKLREKLMKYVNIENISQDSTTTVEYSMDTDYQKLSGYLMTKLNGILNTKINPEPKSNDNSTCTSNILKEIKAQSVPVENKTAHLSSWFNQPLLESCYEKVSGRDNNENELHKPKVADPSKSLTSTTILRNSLNHSRSLSYSRNLQDSKSGVKLVLKYENGKARFVAINNDSQEESKGDDKLGKSAVSMETVKVIKESGKSDSSIPEENIEENADEIVVSMNRKSTSKGSRLSSVEKPSDEFSKAILKPYLHDLDDDLSAPYNIAQIKQFEKGFTESIYERLE
jgi:hypothetical protein